MEKFTKDFVKSDFLKSQNLSFFKSHLRVFGTMIPRKIFFPKIFCVKNIFKKINIVSHMKMYNIFLSTMVIEAQNWKVYSNIFEFAI